VADNQLAEAVHIVVDPMAITDPIAAMEWAKTLHTPHLQESAFEQIYLIWAKNDVDAAMNAANQEVDLNARQAALDAVTQIWANDKPQDFLQWAAD